MDFRTFLKRVYIGCTKRKKTKELKDIEEATNVVETSRNAVEEAKERKRREDNYDIRDDEGIGRD